MTEHEYILVKQSGYEKYSVMVREIYNGKAVWVDNKYIGITRYSSGWRHVDLQNEPYWTNEEEAIMLHKEYAEWQEKVKKTEIVMVRLLQ